jgi:ribosome assembly protein YihI (activator of Der GTPase)
MKNYFDPRIGEVIKMELEITEAISKGHKAQEDDQFQQYRIELKKLREELELKRRAQ